MTLEQAPGSTVEWSKIDHPEKEKIGTIAIPVRDHLNTGTTTSLVMMDKSWLQPGQDVGFQLIQGGILALQRNFAVQRMEGDWLLFIDDDMVWDRDAIGKLVAAREENDLDMLGALCFRRAEPFQPTLYMREEPNAGAYNFLEKWDSDIVEVDATGMAFIIIHKRVFEKIAGAPMPPIEEREALGPPKFFRWDGRLGEDLDFCQQAKAAGCRIFVDTRIEIGHVAEVTIRRKHFITELAFREPEVYQQRLKLNRRMGLPTVSRAEARRELGL